MYTWQTRKDQTDKITPIQDFMIPAGRLSKHIEHLNMFTHESQHTNTHIYAWSQTQAEQSFLFSCVWSSRCFLHRASLRTHYAAAYCYNKASVLCSHRPPPLGMVAIRLYKIAQTKVVLACSTRQVDVVRRVYVWGKLLTISTRANENGMNGAAFSQ